LIIKLIAKNGGILLCAWAAPVPPLESTLVVLKSVELLPSELCAYKRLSPSDVTLYVNVWSCTGKPLSLADNLTEESPSALPIVVYKFLLPHTQAVVSVVAPNGNLLLKSGSFTAVILVTGWPLKPYVVAIILQSYLISSSVALYLYRASL